MKITAYLLSPDHRTGRNKARVFAAALDLRQPDSGELIAALKRAAEIEEAEAQAADQYGIRYMIAFIMRRSGKTALIRSSWIVRTNEDFPRFVTATVGKREADNE